MRWTWPALLGICLVLAGCGGRRTTVFIHEGTTGAVQSSTPDAAQQLGFPTTATKNTTRVVGADPVADAAGVAIAVYPSAAGGTHPTAVTLAPTDDWQAAIASSVLMSSPIRAPILLSGPTSLPSATKDTLKALAPTGAGSIRGAQLIKIGDVPTPPGVKTTAISGADPYKLAASIDRFATAAAGKASSDVVIASGEDPQYAMPAAGWAAESGNPVLFVSRSGIPQATIQALQSHEKPHIFVLGPSTVIPDGILKQLGRYGTVKRVGAEDPVANSVAFALYRDPPCPSNQACAHVPGSFGWAMRSPGHGYTLINDKRTLDAAASAPLSASGSYGPQLLTDSATKLPTTVQNFFLDYATPGFTQEGPTAAVYNHGWMIGDPSAISVGVQAQVDNLLEGRPPAMSQAEHPDRLRPGREVTVDDVRQLMGASTPHFALQLRERIRKLIRDLPAGHPARVEGEREIARLDRLAFAGEVRGHAAEPGLKPLPSVSAGDTR